MIAVEGGAILEAGGLRITFEGTGTNVTATIDGASNAIDALRSAGPLTPIASALVPFLVKTGLTVDVIVAGVHVARAGSGVQPNGLARLLNLSNIQLGN